MRKFHVDIWRAREAARRVGRVGRGEEQRPERVCMGIAFLAVLAAVGAKQAAGGLYTDVTIPDKYHATPLPRRPLFV